MVKIQVFFAVFSMLILFPLASNSEAVLWDLQIEANVENAPLYSGERPIVSGMITDHASKPVQKATVNVRSETMSIFTTTSQSGEFQIELGKHERLPGNYIVNISANATDGKTGLTSIQFQVRGELAHATANQAKLSTPLAKTYLEASPEDFENNPVGFMLYNYYQKLYQESLKNDEISKKMVQEQTFKDQQREEANKQRLKAIEEFNPSYGIFTGPEYDNYVNSLDEGVKDTVIEHLNYTKNLFEEAQILKNEILESGGTAEEAHIAYLDKLTVTREMLETINDNSNKRNNNFNETSNIDSNEDIKSVNPYVFENGLIQEQVQDAILPPLVDKALSGSSIQVNVEGINVGVEFNESIFYVNVNGTVLEFIINGTEITRIGN